MKEWRSKKELDDFIFKEKRYEEIGFVTRKTLRKWGIEIYCEDEDYFYIVQNGNNYSVYIKRLTLN